jgi:hypothetical protein
VYFRSGEEYPLAAITLGPRQTAAVSLNDALRPRLAARPDQNEGTLEIEVSDPNDQALMGTVSVTSPERGIAWNFRLYGLAPTPTALPVRGLFWFHDDQTDGFVAAQNGSNEFLTVQPSFDIAGRNYTLPSMRLAPDHGLKVNLREELRKLGLNDVQSGGIQLAYDGSGGALNAHEVLFNNKGFSTEVDLLPEADAEMDQPFALRTPQFEAVKKPIQIRS